MSKKILFGMILLLIVSVGGVNAQRWYSNSYYVPGSNPFLEQFNWQVQHTAIPVYHYSPYSPYGGYINYRFLGSGYNTYYTSSGLTLYRYPGGFGPYYW